MEEENKKLKKEIADIFKAFDEKESLIQSNKNEVLTCLNPQLLST